ncbi:beta-hydroxyacyl-ACP dehydratase [Streptosporangium carneum]|uniref:Beta-hydroxyacyl-ACP dehydratase n=1 Tax=Streptosporangium carneum TaxID=47481 RepID=A0A9W6I032_9ACTN|nr:beta-hydroxyacyl-ACP dehydratase [Streptosporangium carneum]
MNGAPVTAGDVAGGTVNGIVNGARDYAGIAVGDTLPELSIPLTRTMIVATAIASRDYQDVHHDPELALQRGSKDIFMNILTSNGLVDRFVTGWAGPAAVVKAIRIRLGAPNHPGDTMVLTGTVSAKDDKDNQVEISVRGTNSLGPHVTGTVVVRLPKGGDA